MKENCAVYARVLNKEVKTIGYLICFHEDKRMQFYTTADLKDKLWLGTVVPVNMHLEGKDVLVMPNDKIQAQNFLYPAIVSEIYDVPKVIDCSKEEFVEKLYTIFESFVSEHFFNKPTYFSKYSSIHQYLYAREKCYEQKGAKGKIKELPKDLAIEFCIRLSEEIPNSYQVELFAQDCYGEYGESQYLYDLAFYAAVPFDSIFTMNTFDFLNQMLKVYEKMLFRYYNVKKKE